MIGTEVFIQAPVDVVWRAVTERDQVARWFSDEADLELQDGYQGALTFSDTAQQKVVAHITVRSFEPARSFSYWWSYEPGIVPAPGNSMLVEFTLLAEDGGTRLRVTETGIELLDWPDGQKDEYVVDHNRGWAHHIGTLAGYASAKQPA